MICNRKLKSKGWPLYQGCTFCHPCEKTALFWPSYKTLWEENILVYTGSVRTPWLLSPKFPQSMHFIWCLYQSSPADRSPMLDPVHRASLMQVLYTGCALKQPLTLQAGPVLAACSMQGDPFGACVLHAMLLAGPHHAVSQHAPPIYTR